MSKWLMMCYMDAIPAHPARKPFCSFWMPPTAGKDAAGEDFNRRLHYYEQPCPSFSLFFGGVLGGAGCTVGEGNTAAGATAALPAGPAAPMKCSRNCFASR